MGVQVIKGYKIPRDVSWQGTQTHMAGCISFARSSGKGDMYVFLFLKALASITPWLNKTNVLIENELDWKT